MSSAKGAVAKPARRPKAAARAAAPREAAKPAAAHPPSEASAEANRLAADLTRALAEQRLDLLTPDALQHLMAALCRTYSAQVEAGQQHLPLASRGSGSATSTDIMITASGLLKSANLAVFELGMWQSWTGR